jgi:hypothetical protein
MILCVPEGTNHAESCYSHVFARTPLVVRKHLTRAESSVANKEKTPL